MAAAAGPLYRLADYLDQHGRAHRASQIPPAEFWSAAAAHAAPGDQAALGDAAHARGLYRDAAQLHKNAAASGNPRAVLYLSHPPACLRADPRPAHWAAAHAPLDDPGGVASLLDSLREAGAHEQAAALLARDPAAHAALDDPGGVASLLDSLREAGAHEQAAALAGPDRRPRPPRQPGRRGQPAGQPAGGGRARAGRRAGWPATAAHAALDDPGGVASLLDSLREAGADEQAAALAGRAAAHAPLDDPGGVASLLDSLREAGAHEQAAALAGRARRPRRPRRPGGVASLLDSLREAGADEQAAALAGPGPPPTPPSTTRAPWPACWTACGRRARTSRPPRWLARDPPPTPPSTTRTAWPACWTACGRRARTSRPPRWPARAAAHAPLDDPGAVACLLDSLREAGADEQAAALLARDPAAHAALDDPGGVAACWTACGRRARTSRPPRCWPAIPPPTPPSTTRAAWPACWTACGRRARTSRPPRWPARAAAHAPLDDPGGVAGLLDSLREAGADEQAAALAARAAAHAALDDPDAVASLLDSLREAGAHEQAAALAGRLPAAGMFGLFLEQQGPADQFRFGREADGTPAAPWGWEDLDLWLVPRPRGQAAPAQH